MESMMNEAIHFFNLFNFIEKIFYFICTPVCLALLLWSGIWAIISFVEYRRCDVSKTDQRNILLSNCAEYARFWTFICIVFIYLALLCRAFCIFI